MSLSFRSLGGSCGWIFPGTHAFLFLSSSLDISSFIKAYNYKTVVMYSLYVSAYKMIPWCVMNFRFGHPSYHWAEVFSATFFLLPASTVLSKLSQIFFEWSTRFLDAQTHLHGKNVVARSWRWTATRLLWRKSHYSCDTRCAFDVEYMHSRIDHFQPLKLLMHGWRVVLFCLHLHLVLAFPNIARLVPIHFLYPPLPNAL